MSEHTPCDPGPEIPLPPHVAWQYGCRNQEVGNCNVGSSEVGSSVTFLDPEHPLTEHFARQQCPLITESIKNQAAPDILPAGWTGSTFYNYALKTYDDVAMRIKANLGAPKINISREIDDFQVASFIDQAIEVFTKFAGTTEEFLVFCTDDYEPGCGIRMDKYVNYMCHQMTCRRIVEVPVVTAVDTEVTNLQTVTSLISSFNVVPEPTAVNVDCPTQPVIEGRPYAWVTYNPDNVWQFDPCEANAVVLERCPDEPQEEVICGDVKGLLNVENGLVTIYSENYNELEVEAAKGPLCTPPCSAYWGCCIEEATHVRISGIPKCTVLGVNPLLSNDGKLVTFTHCNSGLNTGGPVPACFDFIKSYEPPCELLGTWPIDAWEGFKVGIEYPECVTEMSTWGVVCATFQKVTTTEHCGVSCYETKAYTDEAFDQMRKVTAVTGLQSSGTFGGLGDDTLYGLDYAIAQNLWNGSAVTARHNMDRSFDFVTYELLGQYIEMARRSLARDAQFYFDPATQYLKLHPEPVSPRSCPTCYAARLFIERPLAQLVQEDWVLNYAMALTMIALGHIRGKFGQVTLFGGGSLNASDMMSQGVALRDKLEKELKEEYVDNFPPRFFLG